MPPKKNLAEELTEALQDGKLVEALGKALSPLISLSVEEALRKQVEGLTTAVRDLKAENTRLARQCDSVAKDNARLQKFADETTYRLNDLEGYTKNDNLIIRGLPERSLAEKASGAPTLDDDTSALQEGHESVCGTVVEFFNTSLGVKVQPQDISIAHRIKADPKDKFRPIIIRFVNRQKRNEVYCAKKTLKSSSDRIYIFEHLTKAASDLFFTARRLLKEKKINATWTQHGQVYVKFTSDPSVRAKLIKCSADLNV